ncbi:GNAT family N-acetyltransferase [Pseudoalteromonas umbrosa]|uniref:GNAT family N-acetyltransferase n=1 Tax=Pseudoalteromonas umbrosa TaxID=3048489 RepID=UPI0024C46619|nr:GNAT family N-acetyltransferase [Pseudoalteromonas sp. B95]MDK1289423.1 GNAT family N-acetyltransferase [Pseudoalteromonas sp. B95]
MLKIKQLDTIGLDTHSQLCDLLTVCIEHGASLGFYTPVNSDMLQQYWYSVAQAIATKERKLYALYRGDALVATVQLSLCMKENGRHRADVEKLLVHPNTQRRGYATILMRHMEQSALENGRTLLVLDTQSTDKAELFYQAFGYTKVGQIPFYVSDNQGQLHSTSYYYKYLAHGTACLNVN